MGLRDNDHHNTSAARLVLGLLCCVLAFIAMQTFTPGSTRRHSNNLDDLSQQPPPEAAPAAVTASGERGATAGAPVLEFVTRTTPGPTGDVSTTALVSTAAPVPTTAAPPTPRPRPTRRVIPPRLRSRQAPPPPPGKQAVEEMREVKADAPAPGYVPRTDMQVDVKQMVERALKEFPDRHAAPPAGADAVSAATNSSAAVLPTAEGATDAMGAYVSDMDGFFAKSLRSMPLEPAYQHTPGKLARYAMVTAWSMAGGQRKSSEVAPAAIFNKVHYCRRHGYDLYVDDTGAMLKRAGYPTRPVYWVKPLSVIARLPYYEWVVWHDIDIFIMDFNRSIDAMVAKHGTTDTKYLIAFEMTWDFYYVNTAHFYVKRDRFSFSLLDQQYKVPKQYWHPQNDQNAIQHVLRRKAENPAERDTYEKQVARVGPPREFGAFVMDVYPSLFLRYRYLHDPHTHLTYCSTTLGCNEAISHLFMTSLAFNGLATGHVPEDVLHAPKRPPLVRGAGVFSDPRPRPAATIGVVTLGSYLQPEGPAWLHEPIAARWKAYCERTGCSYDNRGKPDVIWVWHSEPQIIPETGRLKLAETWLPYFEWVLYVDPDVVLADDARSLQDLVAAVPAHIDVVVSRHADTIDPAAFLVRRSKWSMTLMEEILYRNVPTFTEAAKIVFDFTDPSKRFVEKTGYEPFIEKFHLNPFLTDFSPLIESPTLVGTAPDLCDEGRVCDFKKGSHWFLRIAASACAFVPSACQKTASEFAVPSLALKAPPDEPTAAAVTTTATPG